MSYCFIPKSCLCYQINTKYLEVTTRATNIQFLSVNNYSFQKVTEFKYLGTLIMSGNNITTEIGSRITMVNKCYYDLKIIMATIL
jgi:hypothetical protein